MSCEEKCDETLPNLIKKESTQERERKEETS
jgi:hypothetical protein